MKKIDPKWRVPLAVILVYLALLTLALSGISLSRFASTYTDTDEGGTTVQEEILEPTFVAGGLKEGAQTVIELTTAYPGMVEKTYTFSVTNTDGDTVSGAPIAYTVILRTTNNLPLVLTVSGGDAATTTLTGSGNSTAMQKTVSGTLAANTEETDSYTIRVTWLSDTNSYLFADEIDQITLDFEWQQAM